MDDKATGTAGMRVVFCLRMGIVIVGQTVKNDTPLTGR